MGRVSEGWRDIRDRKSVQVFGAADREGLPEVSELLCGKPNTTGTGWERPPLSVRLYLQGDQVFFCFSAEGFEAQLWGSYSSLKGELLGLEEALCRGHCDWRKKKESDNGFTGHRR